MKNTITQALIYENQGYRDEALEIYKNILKSDPNNAQARSAVRRMSRQKRYSGVNPEMLELFMNLNSDEDEIEEFKRWLVKI